MRLFTTSPCHVTKIGNKTANINAKNIVYHTSYRHSYTSKTAKIKKMVIKLLQQLTFRRYAAVVLSPFFYFCCFRCAIVPLTGVINYVFCIYICKSHYSSFSVRFFSSRKCMAAKIMIMFNPLVPLTVHRDDKLSDYQAQIS